MGPPYWTGAHIQTDRRLYRLLEYKDQEIYEECWADFTEHMAEAPELLDNIVGGGHAVSLQSSS